MSDCITDTCKVVSQTTFFKLATRFLVWLSACLFFILILPGVFAGFAWKICEELGESNWKAFQVENDYRDLVMLLVSATAWVFGLVFSVCFSLGFAISK